MNLLDMRTFRGIGLLTTSKTAACCVYRTVVMYCHTKTSVVARFLFGAQDRNMTNGDYVFFSYWSQRYSANEHPFTRYARYVDDEDDLERRRQAFYVVKQVLVIPTRMWAMPNVMATLPNTGGESSVIPFLVPRRKVWLMPAAEVPCSNAVKTEERKTWM